MKSKEELKRFFENGDIPKQEEFWEWQESYFHKDEKIPTNKIDYDFTKKADLVDGKVPASQLPSYVDDVLEYNKLADFPLEGETGKIYIEINTSKQFRWSGARYIQIIDTSAFEEALLTKLEKPLESINQPDAYNYIPLLNNNNATKKITSQDLGKDLFVKAPSLLNDEEKASWKSQMNGGWTTNTMSVAYIVPPIVDKSDKNTWFTLKGVNLNLNPENFSIDLVTTDGQSVLNIPNNQVQLFQNGTDLIFYYNCGNLLEGEYKVLISNGIASYTTHSTISVSNNLSHVDLSALQWDKKLYNDATSDRIYGRGNVCIFTLDENVKPPARDYTFIASLISKPIIGENQDFILKGSLNMNIYNWEYSGEPEYFFGLVGANVTPDLTIQASPLIKMKFSLGALKWRSQLNISDFVLANNNYDTAISANFSFIRKGDHVVSSIVLPTGTFTTVNQITQGALKFGLFCQNNSHTTFISTTLDELILL